MPCYIEHCVCHFIALRMLGCMLVTLCMPSHLHRVWDRSQPKHGKRGTFRTSSDGTCLNSQSPTLRIIHDGVQVLLCFHVHSFRIESCNSTPRPSCIDMRDWWHEDRGLHSLKSSHAYICENTLSCPFVALCCSKSEISGLLERCAIFQEHLQPEANWVVVVDFCERQLKHASFIIWNRAEAAHRFAC